MSDFIQSHTPPSIGVGQTWQNVLPQRQANVAYKNDTGKPIQLALYNNSGLSVSPNGSTWLTMPTASNATGAYPIIPNGWYYKASYAVGMWLELR